MLSIADSNEFVGIEIIGGKLLLKLQRDSFSRCIETEKRSKENDFRRKRGC